MTTRMRTAIVAGALGVAVLLPGASAFAQSSPPRDPNPPNYDYRYRDGCCHDGYGGCYHHGYYDGRGYYDDRGQWHDGRGR